VSGFNPSNVSTSKPSNPQTFQPSNIPNILALVDDLLFQQPIESAARTLDFIVEFISPPQDVVAFLVDKQPRLIVIDLRTDAWERFVIAAKTSPATRKIPILAFGSHKDTALLELARKAGCDVVVSNGALKADVAGMIAQHAKPDERDEILRQAKLPLPALGHKAVEQFNAKEFWEQHETFEEVWKAEPGPIRQMYQGILQVGVAYLQIQRKNANGAIKLFQRAWQYLNVLPDVCQGVDIAQLRRDARTAQDEVEKLGAARISEFDPSLFKPIVFVNAPINPKGLKDS
jgi:hypothetical protein